ncbi:hypothetical protein LGM43_26645 [Burkholderia seminalis]|uniref:phage tail assembly chaperone n=1 Tax=Burkholderia seminalis TaxID=488731 RepID=UPI001CF390CB|nr:hypothetical protein [Burkholderia seminalis]MCA7953852.1 hypothetical protein [Burkholderia seminalis]
MADEFQLGGHRYQIGRMNARQQFHVSRRIAPLIPPMVPALLKLYSELERARDAEGAAAVASISSGAPAAEALAAAREATSRRDVVALAESVAPVLQPFMDALATLKDDDADYVFDACLSVVERKHMNGWARVWSAQHRTTLFDDIGIEVMLPLVVRVIVANLGNFIGGLLTGQASSPGAAATAG